MLTVYVLMQVLDAWLNHVLSIILLGAIKFGQRFSTLRKMSSNTSSDDLERKLSAPGEKDPEVGQPLSFAGRENERRDSSNHISIWVIVNVLTTVAIVSLKSRSPFYIEEQNYDWFMELSN